MTMRNLSHCESGENRAVSNEAFEKRQGIALEDIPDQLAMESEHHDQIAVESGHKDQIAVESYQNVVPVPVGMPGAPNQVILPVPQGFNPSQAPPPHGHGPMGMRIPPPPQGPHGQFSQHHQSHMPPPPNFQHGPRFPHPQALHQGPPPQYHQGPPPHHFHQQHNNQQQQQQQYQPSSKEQQILQHIQQALPTAGGEVIVQKAQEVAPGQELPNPSINAAQSQHQQQVIHPMNHGGNSGERQNHHQNQYQNHQPDGLVPPPPPPPPHHGRFHSHERDRIPPPKQSYHSGEITKNILRELFERKPNFSKERPNGGFFGPPPPPPGPGHPKVMNRPPIRPPPRPAPGGGGLFTNGKEAALSTNDLNAEGGEIGPIVQYGAPGAGGAGGPWPNGPDVDMPKIVSLEVKCERSVMRVFVAFDKPFFGVIFSKGHYHNVHCIHLPAGLGHTSANFDVGIDACGTQGNSENGLYGYGVQSGSGSYFENTIVIQYDPQVQEVWDQARKLRCTWHDQYEKSVTFRPFPVDMLDVVRADFAGDNVGCWMQIQVGKGPWASEVSGLVKIGQTMTMVLAIKDDDNKFDMMVRNCLAHDGNRAPIQLVDQWGCITRPKLMSRFTKIKNFGASATVLSYAHFQAFKFPDSMEVHFQCTIQICRHQCPEQCSQPGGPGGYVGKSGLPANDRGDREESAAARRRRRAATFNETSTDRDDLDDDDVFEYSTTFKADLNNEDVGLNRVITVVTPDDLDSVSRGDGPDEAVPIIESASSDIVCMSTLGFASMLVLLIGLLLIACVVSAVIVLRRPMMMRAQKQF
ncbi:unnamed protein product [Orchesella dallaii]|uniref:ZP domain-containing protein n=1 Tax=Orchesella dallaii TaxID=48710 RepID=A0ABP1QXZ9_9HEXA